MLQTLMLSDDGTIVKPPRGADGLLGLLGLLGPLSATLSSSQPPFFEHYSRMGVQPD